jgi:hypothetical protein
MLGPSLGYIDILDAYLTNKAEKEATSQRTSNPLRPSAAGFCTKKLGFEFMEYRGLAPTQGEVRAPNVSRLLDFGTAVEYHVIRLFERMDLKAVRALVPGLEDLESLRVMYKQQSLSFFPIRDDNGKGFPELIEGSTDLVFISNKFRCILDVKSKGSKASRQKGWGRTSWNDDDDKLEEMSSVQRVTETLFYVDDLVAFLDELDDAFLAHNFYQLNLYAMSDFMRERGIDHASILQYAKNDSRMREIRFRPSQTIYDLVKLKFTKVAEAVDVHQDISHLPQDHNKSSLVCKYCTYKTQCWKKKED